MTWTPLVRVKAVFFRIERDVSRLLTVNKTELEGGRRMGEEEDVLCCGVCEDLLVFWLL